MNSETSYDQSAAVQADRAALHRYLERVTGGITQIGHLISRSDACDQEAAPGILRQLADACRYLAETTNALTDADPGECQQLALSATAQMQALESDVDDAEDQVAASTVTADVGMSSRIFAMIRNALGKAGKHLWSLISRLLTVKEWSVTGTAGTGVLGFASATITFG